MSEPAWADLKGEIDRKALDAMSRAIHDYEIGKLSGKELWLIANSIHDVVQGIATSETTDMIYNIRQELVVGD